MFQTSFFYFSIYSILLTTDLFIRKTNQNITQQGDQNPRDSLPTCRVYVTSNNKSFPLRFLRKKNGFSLSRFVPMSNNMINKTTRVNF